MTSVNRDEQGYNGWTNYETWNVKLWMDNKEPSYLYWKETAELIWEESEADPPFTKSEKARFVLADHLKNEIADDGTPDLGASMYGDLLGAALDDVNWHEISDSLLGAYCNEYEHRE